MKYVTQELGVAVDRVVQHGHRVNEDIIAEVVDKAEGVWIWVYLVVNILSNKIDEGGDYNELLRELLACPKDLDQLYVLILKKIPEDYIHDAVKYLRLLHVAGSLSFQSFAFAARQDPIMSRTTTPTFDTKFRPANLCSGLTLRIMSRGGGLIQVSSSPERCTLLHLTLKEFMSKDQYWAKLMGEIGFANLQDPKLCLMAMHAVVVLWAPVIHSTMPVDDRYDRAIFGMDWGDSNKGKSPIPIKASRACAESEEQGTWWNVTKSNMYAYRFTGGTGYHGPRILRKISNDEQYENDRREFTQSLRWARFASETLDKNGPWWNLRQFLALAYTLHSDSRYKDAIEQALEHLRALWHGDRDPIWRDIIDLFWDNKIFPTKELKPRMSWDGSHKTRVAFLKFRKEKLKKGTFRNNWYQKFDPNVEYPYPLPDKV